MIEGYYTNRLSRDYLRIGILGAAAERLFYLILYLPIAQESALAVFRGIIIKAIQLAALILILAGPILQEIRIPFTQKD